LKEGLIVKTTGSSHWVKFEGGVKECKIKGKMRMSGIRSTNPLAVGDIVEFEEDENDPLGVICKIKERKNYIIRKSINLSKESQVIAANIDLAFLVVTVASPETATTFIDRFLATAEAYRISCVVVINKIDLYSENDQNTMADWIDVYQTIGYPVVPVSAATGHNIDRLREMMKGKLCLFSGNSGVGKSTLINKIDANLSLKTGAISASHHKGKHTTTFSEVFEVEGGSMLIDTPGLKSFGVLDMEKDNVSHYFPEMFRLSKECQYGNCTHTHEPKCAVKQGLEDGRLAISRYNSYLSMIEADGKYR